MDQEHIDSLKGSRKANFTAIQIDLPDDNVLRLVSGGFVSFDVDGVSESFDSESTDFGTLGTVSSVREGTEGRIVSVSISLHPHQSGIALLTAPEAQRSPVRVWEGVVSADSGAVQGDPVLVFTGELDYSTAPRGRNTSSLVLECLSQEYFQKIPDDQIRLNDAFMRSVWGSDVLGLSHVYAMTNRKRYWQIESPRASISYGTGGSGAVNDDTLLNFR